MTKRLDFAPGVAILPVTAYFWGREMLLHPVLLHDRALGATLLDTGMPDHADLFLQQAAELGVTIRRILLTHQDFDHIGAAWRLRQETGAKVLAHPQDAPYIRGEEPLLKFQPERAAPRLRELPPDERQAMEAILRNLPSTPVDGYLEDGSHLPEHGGIVVIHTPGHTPGHVSLYLQAYRLLVAGDALRVEDGQLLGPNPANTLDLPTATRSLERLLAFPIDYVLCYHGGLYGPGAKDRIEALAAGAA